MKKVIRVGVFPLRNLILFPNTVLPLVIQDENYQKMIEDSIRLNFPIAIGLGDVVIRPDGGVSDKLLRPKEIMGLGLASLTEDYSDNSTYVIFQGIGKVRLLNRIQQMPYLLCEAEVIYDNEQASTEMANNPISRLETLLITWLKQNITDPVHLQSMLKSLNTVNHIIDYICTFMIHDRDLRQVLLEINSLTERIHILDALLVGKNPQKESHSVANMIKRFEFDDRLTAASQ